MSDGTVTLFVEVQPESLAGWVVHSLSYDEIIQLVMDIDSEVAEWGFTTKLVRKLQEGIGE